MADQVKLGLDAGDFIDAAGRVFEAITGQADAVEELVVQMTKYNSKQEEVSQTFKALTADGKEFTVEIEKTKAGYHALDTVIKESAEARRAGEAAAKKAAEEKDKADLLRLQNQEAYFNRLEQLEAARLKALDLYNREQAKAAKEEAKLEEIRVAAQEQKNRKAGAGAVEETIRARFNTDGLNLSQLASFEASIQRIKQALLSGNVTFERFKQLADEVSKNPLKPIPNLTGEEQRVVDTLRQLDVGFKQVDGSTKGWSDTLTKTFSGILRFVGFQLLRQSIRGLINEFKDSLHTIEEFTIKIGKIQALTGESANTTGRYQEEISRLSNQFGIPQLQVADAAYAALQSRVVDTTNFTEILSTAFKLQSATTLDAKQSITLLDTTLNAFNIDATQADRVANVLFKTIQGGSVNAQKLTEIIGRLGHVASGSGVSLEEVAAALDALAQKGLKEADSATLIEATLRALQRPSKELQRIFDEVGAVSAEHFVQLQGGFGGVLKLFDQYVRSGKNIGELTQTFHNLRPAVSLTGETFDKYNDSLAKVTDGTNKLDDASRLVQDTLGQKFRTQIEQLKTAFTDVVSERFVSGLGVVLDKLTNINQLVSNLKFGQGTIEGKRFTGEVEERERQEAFAKSHADEIEAEKKKEQEIINNLKASYAERYGALLKYSGLVVKEADDTKRATVKNLKEIEEATKIAGKSFTDAIEKNVTALGQKASQAKSMIEESLKVTETLSRRSADSLFKERLKYASPDEIGPFGNVQSGQQTTLIQQRIKQLQDEARKGFASGSKESVADARKAFDEIEKLQEQLFQHRTELEKKAFEEQVKAGRVAPTGLDAQGRPKYEFVARTAELERQINKTLTERQDLENKLQDKLAERKKTAEDEQAKEKERLRTIQQVLLEAEKFSVLDDQGKIKDKYKRDPTQASKDFDEYIKRLGQLSTGDEQKNFDVFRDLYQLRRGVVKEVQAYIVAEETHSAAERLTRQKSDNEKFINDQKAAIDKAQLDRQKLLQKLSAGIEGGDVALTKSISLGAEPGPEYNPTAATAQLESAKDAYNKLKEARTTFQESGSVEDLRKLQDAATIFTEAADKYVRLRTGYAPEFIGPGGSKGQTIQSEVLNPITDAVKQLEVLNKGIDEAKAKINERTNVGLNDLKNQVDSLPKTLNDTRVASSTTADQFVQDFDKMKGSAKSITDELEKIQGLLEKIKLPPNKPSAALIPGSQVNENPEERWAGGPIYRASGGSIDWAPKGRDNIPVMAEQGEYMMNADAYRRFAPLIQAMNAGSIRSHSDLPGGSITNVGDIHVTVQGGGSNQQTIKNLGTELRRAIKRGEISLEAK